MKECQICHRTEDKCRIRTIKSMDLCPKHVMQYYRYGCFLDRTIYDPNDYVLHDDYAEIILRNKDCEEVGRAIIDLEDVELCKKYKWYLRESLHTNYAIARLVGDKKIFLHRLIIDYNGPNPIDHIDHNGLNNRRGNLRICSTSENIFNRRNSPKGVRQVPSGRYAATIMKDYNSIYLGTFDTYEEARQARKKAEKELFGDIGQQATEWQKISVLRMRSGTRRMATLFRAIATIAISTWSKVRTQALSRNWCCMAKSSRGIWMAVPHFMRTLMSI